MLTPAQGIAKAAAAYSKAANGSAVSGLNARDALPKSDFASLVTDAVKGAIEASKQSEAMSIKAISGKADLTKVITSVSEAEVTLQTVVAIRDKVIDAYREIVRMPM